MWVGFAHEALGTDVFGGLSVEDFDGENLDDFHAIVALLLDLGVIVLGGAEGVLQVANQLVIHVLVVLGHELDIRHHIDAGIARVNWLDGVSVVLAKLESTKTVKSLIIISKSWLYMKYFIKFQVYQSKISPFNPRQ